MSGIGNYFHGENGIVTELKWVACPAMLVYRMSLRDNPHRLVAQDYRSDIGIDPALQPEDKAVYVRLNPYCGIWVREGEDTGLSLDQAEERVKENNAWMVRYRRHFHWSIAMLWAKRVLPGRTGLPVDIAILGDQLPRPASTLQGLVVAAGGTGVADAKYLVDGLNFCAKNEAWRVLGPVENPPLEDILEWATESEATHQVLLLLFSDESVMKPWLEKGIPALSRKLPKLHVILLPHSGATVRSLPDKCHFITCNHRASGEVKEEVYAVVHGYPGRASWLKRQGIA